MNIIKYICLFHESIRNITLLYIYIYIYIYVLVLRHPYILLSAPKFYFVCLFSLYILNVDHKVQPI